MDSDNESTGLTLSLTTTTTTTTTRTNFNTKNKENPTTTMTTSIMKFDHVLPCLSLAPARTDDHQISISPKSTSSYSNNNNNNNNSSSLKRTTSDQEVEEGSPRKKLRLTKHQSDVLEESFKDHPTLNPNQKQALAKQLSLRPRQVEVWFQNRRARTKLKHTEMECELLKKRCEKLTEDNKRLQKELHELKSVQLVRLFMD